MIEVRTNAKCKFKAKLSCAGKTLRVGSRCSVSVDNGKCDKIKPPVRMTKDYVLKETLRRKGLAPYRYMWSWDHYDTKDWAVHANGKNSYYIVAKAGFIYKIIGEPNVW